MSKYVLITAAKNEEDFIEKTIKAVLSQTVKPVKWVIVSDGSTDKTDVIVSHYAAKHQFISLIRTEGDPERNFGSKAKAVNYGYQTSKNKNFDFIGNLDADISFSPTYYEDIMKKFKQNEKLGLAGGVRFDLVNGRFRRVVSSDNSVGGPFQFFRKECFEKIGGYIPLQYGGIDAAAEIMVRMFNWEVRSFKEIKVYHYRRTGSSGRNVIRTNLNAGIRDYLLGYHPVFEIVRNVRRITNRPFFFGSAFLLAGYFSASIKKMVRPVPQEFISFLRKEQITRLQNSLLRT